MMTLTVPNLDETLVEASILLVRHPHRLLGVVGLQGILLLHLKGDEEERSRICMKLENSMVFNENKLIFILPGSGSLRPPVLTWPGMLELGWSHWLGRTWKRIFNENSQVGNCAATVGLLQNVKKDHLLDKH